MNFSAIAGSVPFGKLFSKYGPKQPSGLDESELIEERKFLNSAIKMLSESSVQLTLAKDGLPPKQITVDALRYVCPSRLRLSIFDTLSYQLSELREYHGATIWVEAPAIERFGRAICAESRPKGGRPIKSKQKDWYMQECVDSQYGSAKAILRAMFETTGESVHDKTLRRWRKEKENADKTLG